MLSKKEACTISGTLNKLTLFTGEGAHPQKDDAMLKATDICAAIGSFSVTNWDLDNFKVQLMGAKK